MATTDGKYHVARPTGRCAASDRLLEPGEACMAVLCADAEGTGFLRLDYGLDDWESASRPPAMLAHWKTTVPDREAPRRLLVDDQVLLELFGRLDGEEDPRRQAFRFVLALVLLRKRLLKFESRSEDENGTTWTLRQRGPAGADMPGWTVCDPGLDDDGVVDLHEQLGEILQGDL